MSMPPQGFLEEMATARVAPLAASALATLHARLGFRAWVVARREDGDWVPFVARPQGGLTAFAWRALCARVAEVGPIIHPRGEAELGVGAYAGAPLRLPDGRVFGVVCGADTQARPDAVQTELPLLVLIGELLSGAVAAEVRAQELARRAERAEALSRRDPLTGLGNRRMWDRLLIKEEERCRRMGLEAAVLVVDLDNLKEVNDQRGHAAGDELLRLSASILARQTREPDDVARIGGDEFAIVAGDCGPEDRVALVARLREALERAGVHASIGAANRTTEGGLAGAWSAADEAMYRDKRDRRPRDAGED
jgi:diguanylate cyclase (GGDEF)-like protein